MRRLASWGLAAVTLVLLLATTPSAQAIDLNPFDSDCTASLVIGTPSAGPANSMDSGPKNPHGGDPFAKHPKVSVYEAYGYGGLSWPDFDCGGVKNMVGTITHPVAAGANAGVGSLANIGMALLGITIAVCATLVRVAFDPGTLALFDPIMRLAAEALGNAVFRALFWVTLIGTGIGIVWNAQRAKTRAAATATGWVLFVMLIGTTTAAYPLVVAPKIDAGLTSLINGVNTQLAGASGAPSQSASDGVAANLHHSLIYQTWCSGMVGRSAGKTADEFCPRLFKASHMSRSEFTQTQKAADPAKALNDAVKAKGPEFTSAVDDLKKADPVAYSFMVGNHNGERAGYVALAWFAFFCSSPFMVVSALLLLMALIKVRLAIMAAPAVAVVGGYPPMRKYMLVLFDHTTGAIMAAAVFGCLAAVFIAGIGAFMSPTTGVNPVLSALLLLIATIAAWKFSKPFKRLKDMTTFSRKGGTEFTIKDPAPSQGDANNPGPATTPSSDGGSMFRPAQPYRYAAATPAEAKPSMFKAAAQGAAQGAATTAAVGLATGGTVTFAAAAAGAAKGAAISAGAAKFGTAGALTGMATTSGLGAGTAQPEVAAQEAPTARAHDTTTPQEGRALPAAPTPHRAPSATRVYRPGERNPAEALRAHEPVEDATGEKVYPIYKPEPKGANA